MRCDECFGDGADPCLGPECTQVDGKTWHGPGCWKEDGPAVCPTCAETGLRPTAAKDVIADNLPAKWPWNATDCAEVIVAALWDAGYVILPKQKLPEVAEHLGDRE